MKMVVELEDIANKSYARLTMFEDNSVVITDKDGSAVFLTPLISEQVGRLLRFRRCSTV